MRRSEVIPGARACAEYVIQGGAGASFSLNPHLMLSLEGWSLLPGQVLDILTKPRKVNGFDLVRVRCANGAEGEVLYSDLIGLCSLVPAPLKPKKTVKKSVPKRLTSWERLLGDDE